MTVKLLTEHHLEFLSFIGGCRGLSESTVVKMPHCWKSHALAHIASGNDIYLNAKVSQLLLKFYFLLFETKILFNDIVINKSNYSPS